MRIRGKDRMRLVIALVVGVLLLAMGQSAMAVPPPDPGGLTGAIFTSDSSGTGVNLNIYDNCTDVYLNGGPQNDNSPGLPDGTYYFQVTDPDGSLLSTDNAGCRQLTVSSGRVAGAAVAAGSCAHPNGTFNQANSSTPVQLAPFDTTSNPGQEYKVWLIAQNSSTSIDGTDPTVIHFNNNDSKTDNFKVENACDGGGGGGGGATNTISGFKFYDANVDGVFGSGELGIPGWKIFIFGAPELFDPFDTTTVMTDFTGEYSFINLEDGTYGACEVLPSNAPAWVPTTPTQITGITVPPDSINNNFGNVCLGTGGGKTLGFWSNKNGQAVMNDGPSKADPELALLSGLCLRKANGSDFNPGPGSYSSFRSWILSATATNMAYMLSAQLAAMELNVESGQVANSSIVYAPGCGDTALNSTGNFITVNNLMTTANAQLCLNGTTFDGDPNRPIQECLKNALDNGNNNRNFVQATACEVNYRGNELTCVPVP